MEKITVTLKQHTPLIHFQHEQDGATLRASEVKPKLDKFIINKLGNEDSSAKKENHSLQYKVKIVKDKIGESKQYMIASYLNDKNIVQLNNRGIQVISNSPYFAQESENKNVISHRTDWNKVSKKGLYFSGHIEVTITIFHKLDTITNALKNYIQDFFIVHNFGTRQSKGFGSFSVSKIVHTSDAGIEANIQLKSIEQILKNNYIFVYKKEILPDFNTIFSTINNDYKLIKSGTSRPYSKSKLMLYFNRSGIRWEKKFIKCFFTDAYEDKKGDCYILKSSRAPNYTNGDEELNYMYVRALLGLAEQYEFLLENPPLEDNRNKLIVKIKSDSIQRYQSPLLYKVYDEAIFLVGNDVHEQMKGASFSLLVNIQEDLGYKDDLLGNTSLVTPLSFSLPEFMHFALNPNDYTELQNNNI